MRNLSSKGGCEGEKIHIVSAILLETTRDGGNEYWVSQPTASVTPFPHVLATYAQRRCFTLLVFHFAVYMVVDGFV